MGTIHTFPGIASGSTVVPFKPSDTIAAVLNVYGETMGQFAIDATSGNLDAALAALNLGIAHVEKLRADRLPPFPPKGAA